MIVLYVMKMYKQFNYNIYLNVNVLIKYVYNVYNNYNNKNVFNVNKIINDIINIFFIIFKI